MSWTAPDKVEIRTLPQGGFGVFATRFIREGEVIGIFQGEVKAFPLYGGVPDYGEENPHMMLDLHMDGQALYALTLPDLDCAVNRVNHSCSPNCRLDGVHGLTLVANRVIPPGEELTFDYRPITLLPVMLDCWCESHACRL